jgi:hypothetical protein
MEAPREEAPINLSGGRGALVCTPHVIGRLTLGVILCYRAVEAKTNPSVACPPIEGSFYYRCILPREHSHCRQISGQESVLNLMPRPFSAALSPTGLSAAENGHLGFIVNPCRIIITWVRASGTADLSAEPELRRRVLHLVERGYIWPANHSCNKRPEPPIVTHS